MIKILGIDQSLNASGFCQLITRAEAEPAIFCHTFSPKTTGAQRLLDIERHLIEQVSGKGIDLVLIEGYAYGRPDGMAALGELGGIIRLALHKRQQPFIIVPPKSLKLWATGNGNAPKGNVYRAAMARCGIDAIADDNQADAAYLAEIGLYVKTGTAGKNNAQRRVLAILRGDKDEAARLEKADARERAAAKKRGQG